MFHRTTLARLGLSLITSAVIFAAACSSDDGSKPSPLVVEEGCQPLLAQAVADTASQGTCLLPYPSDFYRATQNGTSRITLTGKAKPRLATGTVSDIHDVVPMDGFSQIPTIVATLPSNTVRDGLPNLMDDPAASATATSPTVILDTETGTLVPHYVDKIDHGVDDTHQPIVLRPFSPLAPKRRYVVALQGVRTGDKVAPPPEGFRRLRDHVADAALKPLDTRYDADVFAPLEHAGVHRAALQLAWDFTTGAEESPRADMLRVRDLTLAWLQSNTPQVAITETKDGTGTIWKTINGTLTGPLFLDKPGVGGRIFRGGDGQVAQNGTATFPFTISVPNAVRDRFEPGLALAYGHGFFGGRDELDDDSSKQLLNRLGAVGIAIDWWGMSDEDFKPLSELVGSDPQHASDFVERVHQAMANWIVTTAAFRGPLAKAAELMRPATGTGVVSGPGGASNAGKLVYDPSFVGYFGASQGHILGGTLVALDPDFTRAVLNVGGGGFTHIMPRSANFGPLSVVLGLAFKDELMVQAMIGALQRTIDRIDPITYAPLVGKGEQRVLLQTGLGDAQVPNLAGFLHARALGIKMTTPSPRPIYGVEPATDPTESAITLFDFGIDTNGYRNPSPLSQNDVHQSVRVNAKALDEMAEFLRPGGTIKHPCDGPCDPE